MAPHSKQATHCNLCCTRQGHRNRQRQRAAHCSRPHRRLPLPLALPLALGFAQPNLRVNDPAACGDVSSTRRLIPEYLLRAHRTLSDTAAPTAAPSCASLLRAPHHELSRFAWYHTTETQSDRLSGRPRACSCPPPSPLPRWASRSPSQASNAPPSRAAGDL